MRQKSGDNRCFQSQVKYQEKRFFQGQVKVRESRFFSMSEKNLEKRIFFTVREKSRKRFFFQGEVGKVSFSRKVHKLRKNNIFVLEGTESLTKLSFSDHSEVRRAHVR